MSLLILPFKKPQQNKQNSNGKIDFTNPFISGLVLAHALGEHELISEKIIQKTNFTRGSDVNGEYNSFSNTGRVDYGQTRVIPGNASAYTVLAAGIWPSTGRGHAFSQGLQSSPYPQTTLAYGFNEFGGNSDGSITFMDFGGGGVVGVSASATVLNGADNKYHVVCGVRNGNASNTKVYIDGINRTSLTTGNNNTIDVASQKLALGNDADYAGTDRAFNSPLYIVLVWDRILSEVEIRTISDNPWQIFELRENYFFFTPSAELSLVLANISQSQVISNTNLIQQNTLNIANCSESSILANIELTQQNILVLQALVEEAILSSPILTVATNLSINGIEESTSLTNIGLTQQNVLYITDMTQAAVLENITLTQQNVLSVSSLNSEETINNIVLSIAGTLVINSLVVTQTLELLNLVQANILTIQSVVSTETLENITLSSGILLAPNNIQEIQSLATLALVQANVLQMQGLLSQASLQNITLTVHSTLIINDLLYNSILQNITLLEGVLEYRLEGKPIFVLRSNPSIMIIDSNLDIFMKRG